MARKKKPTTVARRKRTTPAARKTRRRRGLSEGPKLPVIGVLGIKNPLIGGIVGAIIGMAVKNMVPDDFLDDKVTKKPHPLKPYIKGAALAAGALVAKNMKQDAIAAGMVGAAAVLTLQNLEVPGLSENSANWADPSVFLSETALLSAGDIYPQYGTMLHDTTMLSAGY